MRRGAWLGFLSAVIGVLAVAAPAAEATFPGANGKLVWTGSGNCVFTGCVTAIYTGSLDGSDKRVLTDPAYYSFDGVWSPDGRHIAYLTDAPIAPGVPFGGLGLSLAVMDADGSHKHYLLPPGTSTGLPLDVGNTGSWMPDGFFLVYGDAQGQLWETNLLGAPPIPVAYGKTIYDSFRVSPDGRRIAYLVGNSSRGIPGQLRMMNFDGSADHVVTNLPAGYFPFNVDWSPNGKRLIFDADKAGCCTFVYEIDANGSNEQQVTSGRQPLWSPDGTKIGFVARTLPTEGQFTLANLDGSNQQTTPVVADNPDWQPLPR